MTEYETLLLKHAELVALSIRKLALAASDNLGSDCYMHAMIAKSMLTSLGVVTRLNAGNAAWRLGNGDGDVVTHIKLPGVPYQANSYPYHIWLTCDRYLLDVTTYQLRAKARTLDELDGGKTTVDWCPDYLLVERDTVASFQDCQQKNAGVYHYRRDDVTEAIVLRKETKIDDEDLAAAWMIYKNPEINVEGPNTMSTLKP